MPEADEDDDRATNPVGVTEDDILSDMASRYAGVLCPEHGVSPKFEMDEKGGVIERLCCASLAQIFRELRVQEADEDAADKA